jgi:hypothetical protein
LASRHAGVVQLVERHVAVNTLVGVKVEVMPVLIKVLGHVLIAQHQSSSWWRGENIARPLLVRSWYLMAAPMARSARITSLAAVTMCASCDRNTIRGYARVTP